MADYIYGVGSSINPYFGVGAGVQRGDDTISERGSKRAVGATEHPYSGHRVHAAMPIHQLAAVESVPTISDETISAAALRLLPKPANQPSEQELIAALGQKIGAEFYNAEQVA